MKAKTLLIIALALPVSIVAQNTTFSIPVGSSHSIVREFKENIFIVYNTDGTDYSVSYADLAAGMVLSAQLPAADVADFEIYNGTVYFCGTAYGTPVAGWFDIVDLFFYGGQIEFSILTNTTACTQYNPLTDYDQVTALKKIEVMPVSGSRPHLLMVGEAACSQLPGKVNRCIVDLYYDGTDWISAVSQAHDNIVYYDDVAVTDNYVPVVAHKHGAEAEYVLQFKRPTAGADNIFTVTGGFAYPVSANNYISGGVWSYSQATDEEFLIRHIKGDCFATVCHGFYNDNSGLHEGTVLNLYNSVFNVANRYFVNDYGTTYSGLRYNHAQNSLYLMPGDNSTCPGSYLEFDLDYTYLAVNGVWRHSDISLAIPELTSIDAAMLSLYDGCGQAILSGQDCGKLVLWRHLNYFNTICTVDDIVPLTAITRGNQVEDYQIRYRQTPIIISTIAPSIIPFPADIICTE